MLSIYRLRLPVVSTIYLFSCPMYINAVSYRSLVRPILEYALLVWCLHTSKDISQLESIQQCATRWVCGSLRWNPDTWSWSKSLASCLQELKWPSLHSRWSYFSVSLVHVILHQQNNFYSIQLKFSIFSINCHLVFPLLLSIPTVTL